MRKLLQWIKEFKPHIVQFDDGTYGVLKRTLIGITFYTYYGTVYAKHQTEAYRRFDDYITAKQVLGYVSPKWTKLEN